MGSRHSSTGASSAGPHNRDATLHDHDAEPLPERDITDLDQLRALLRWRLKHEHPDQYHGTGNYADEPDAAHAA